MKPPDDRYARRLAELQAELAEQDREEEQQDRQEEHRKHGAAGAEVVESTTPVGRRAGRLVRSMLFWIALVVLVAGLSGLAVTLHRLSADDITDAQREGQATVESCVRHGPVTTRGFGYWESCQVRIIWSGGETESWDVNEVFRSSDIGATIQVGDMNSGSSRAAPALARADVAPRPWLKWLSYAVGVTTLVPALFMGLILGIYPGRRRKRHR